MTNHNYVELLPGTSRTLQKLKCYIRLNMSIKNDKWIVEMSKKGMIEPFEPRLVKGGISYGTGSYGYDFRIAEEFKIFNPENVYHTPEYQTIVDPKLFDETAFTEHKGSDCVIGPHGYVLARTVEYFRIPRNILTICYGKSTYARSGILVNVTPFEPEWEGYATIAISNLTPYPARIHANEGIGQLIFLEADQECETSYADRKGKYQAQKEITHAKVS